MSRKGILFWIVPLGIAAALVIGYSRSHAEEKTGGSSSPFRVTARLIAPNEYRNEFGILQRIQPYFEARCTVTNVSQKPQAIVAYNCSWNDNWHTNVTRIFCPGWECSRNFPEKTVLKPGERYEKVLPLTIREGTQGKTLGFRIGFSPYPHYLGPGTKRKPPVIWSEPLMVAVPQSVSKPAMNTEAMKKKTLQVGVRLLAPKDYRREFAIHRELKPYFEAYCTVTNLSSMPQTIRTSSCSWNANWETDNKRIYCPGWGCIANAVETIVLKPGARYEKVLPLTADAKVNGRTVRFRVGFFASRASGDQPQTPAVWSDPLFVSVPK